MTNRQIEVALGRMCEAWTEWGRLPDACIAATRVAIHALAEKRVPARALHVSVVAYNPPYRELLEARHADPEGWDSLPHDEKERLTVEWRERGAWSVLLGFGADPRAKRPGYDGHVVAIVKERWLLDLTIGQAARPHKGIHLEAGFAPVDRDFLRGEKPITFKFGDATAIYYAEPERRGYLLAPDWKHARRGDPLAQELAEVLEGKRVNITTLPRKERHAA